MSPQSSTFNLTLRAHVAQYTGSNQQEIADFVKQYLLPDSAISDGPNGSLEVQYGSPHGRVGVNLEQGQHVVVLLDRVYGLGESDLGRLLSISV